MTTTTMTTTTRTIAGHEITLTPGRRYLAFILNVRRGKTRAQRVCRIKVIDITDGFNEFADSAWTVDGIVQNTARLFVNEFNAGVDGVEGRDW